MVACNEINRISEATSTQMSSNDIRENLQVGLTVNLGTGINEVTKVFGGIDNTLKPSLESSPIFLDKNGQENFCEESGEIQGKRKSLRSGHPE